MKTLFNLIATLLLTISSKASEDWKPPIGIPEPSWGALGNPIKMAAPVPPNPWTSEVAGVYYVAQAEAGAWDAVYTAGQWTYNKYGLPGSARITIPSPVPAGSVVYINGGYTSTLPSRYPGTETAPIWVLSYDPSNRSVFTKSFGLDPTTSYLILDNLDWKHVVNEGGQIELGGGVNHLCLRNCSITGPASETGTESVPAFHKSTMVIQSTESYGGTEQLVFYNTKFTKGGNWMYAEGDPDAHGVSFGKFVQDMWIVDCDFSYLSGCAVQVGAGTTGATPDSEVSRRIYVGRCSADHIAQSAFWSKRADDVIFSQNVCHTIRRDAPSSPNSAGFGGQYGPRNLWIIYNTVYDCQSGAVIASSSLGPEANSTDVFFVGNVFHNIRDKNGPVAADWRSNAYSGEGVCVASWSQPGWVVANTFYDYDAGILCPATALTWRISANLFTNRAGNLGTDVNVQDPSGKNVITTNLFQDPYVQNNDKPLTSLTALNTLKGPGNLIGSPTFINEAVADFRLKDRSVGVDAAGADADAVYDIFSGRYGRSIRIDRLGVSRPQNGKWDIGALEFNVGEGPQSSPPKKPQGVKITEDNSK